MDISLREIQDIESSDGKHYFPELEQDVSYLSIALTGEVGEFCNDVKKYLRGSITYNELAERSEGELADVLIYLVMVAEQLDIDLEHAWRRKKAYNDERYKRTTAETK